MKVSTWIRGRYLTPVNWVESFIDLEYNSDIIADRLSNSIRFYNESSVFDHVLLCFPQKMLKPDHMNEVQANITVKVKPSYSICLGAIISDMPINFTMTGDHCTDIYATGGETLSLFLVGFVNNVFKVLVIETDLIDGVRHIVMPISEELVDYTSYIRVEGAMNFVTTLDLFSLTLRFRNGEGGSAMFDFKSSQGLLVTEPVPMDEENVIYIAPVMYAIVNQDNIFEFFEGGYN